MRKFLLCFLILLMLTPGLACGPFMGAARAQAAEMSMPAMSDCQGMAMDGQKKISDNDDHIFFKDCAKVDLSGVDHASLQMPDLDGKIFLAAWTGTVPESSFTPAEINAIRGPPPDWPGLFKTQPPILLTTQRIRE